MATKKSSSKKRSSKRELIDTGKNKMYGRRDKEGKFSEMDDVGRSLAADVRKPAKKKVKVGEGDKGDQPKRKK